MTNRKVCLRFVAAIIALAYAVTNSAAELEEILVTATKRPETEFSIPLSIETITGEQIEERGIKDFEDLAATVPNFFLADGVVSTSIMIRGQGSGTERGFEQTVGMFIDGIYMPRSRQYRSPFFDANRVEIVRGPQAVLFGLNSTAGAVSVISNKTLPGDEAFVELRAGFETEYDGNSFSLIAGTSIGDRFAIRVALKDADSGDGHLTNLFDNSDHGGTDESLARITAVFAISDNVELTAKYDHAEFDVDGATAELYGGAPPLGSDGDDRKNWVTNIDAIPLTNVLQPIYGGYDLGLFQELDNYMLSLDWQLGEHVLTATIARSEYEYEFATELDYIPLPILDAALTEEYEQTSAEIRLTSPAGETIEYFVGAYFAESELRNLQPSVLSLAVLGAPGLNSVVGTDSSQDTDTASIYGSLTWNVSDRTRLTIGARYNDEDKSLDRTTFCNFALDDGTIIGPSAVSCPSAGDHNTKRNSTNFMPEIIVERDINDSTLLYGKISTSAKSGGFVFSGSAPSLADLEYDDEEALSYEIGLKSRFAENRAEFNLTLFQTTFEDLQLSSFQGDGAGGFVSLTSNAGESESQGLEAELLFAATDYVTLSLSAAYLDAAFTDFKLAACYAGELDPNGDGVCDHSGDDLPFAPELSASASATFGIPVLDGLELFGGASVNYSDSYLTDGTLDPAAEQGSYSKVDANIGLRNIEDTWSISVIGRNLSDKYVLNVSQPGTFGGYIGYGGRPRTVAVNVKYSF